MVCDTTIRLFPHKGNCEGLERGHLPLHPPNKHANVPTSLRRVGGARLPQRVAMDDLASYFVEERSKVR